MKQFIMRAVSVGAVVILLAGYNHVLDLRAKDEEIARLTAEVAAQKADVSMSDSSVSGEGSSASGAGPSALEADKAASGEESADTGADSAGYKDGIYTGTGDGFGGRIEVQVTVAAGRIAEIVIVSADGEDGAYLTMAQEMIPRIVDSQNIEADTVSGATFSSSGIRDAVQDALQGVSVLTR